MHHDIFGVALLLESNRRRKIGLRSTEVLQGLSPAAYGILVHVCDDPRSGRCFVTPHLCLHLGMVRCDIRLFRCHHRVKDKLLLPCHGCPTCQLQNLRLSAHEIACFLSTLEGLNCGLSCQPNVWPRSCCTPCWMHLLLCPGNLIEWPRGHNEPYMSANAGG